MAFKGRFKFGQKVGCRPNDNFKKPVVGFVVGDEHETGDGVKSDIQVGDNVYPLAYREPGDRQGGGDGGTFWTEL